MKYSFRKIMVIMALFAGFATVQANAGVGCKEIVIEFPSDLPEPAQGPIEAMHLYQTWRAEELELLYLEKDQGRKLVILDVSDPSHIRVVGQVSIAARSTYDFVQKLGNSMALIRYRTDSGFAVISFKNYKQPVLLEEPAYQHPANVEVDGPSGLMLISANNPSIPSSGREFEVLCVSDTSAPRPIATIQNVIQRVDIPETGTIFFLNDRGVTVVRQPFVEQEHRAELLWKKQQN